MELLKTIVAQAQPLVLTLLGLLFAWLANEVRAKVHSTRAQGILLRLTDLAETVTGELKQTTVDAVKAAKPGEPLDGAFAAQVKDLAVARVTQHLGPKGVSEVLSVFGYKSPAELEALVASKVESALLNNRQFGPLLQAGVTAVEQAVVK